MIGDNDGLNRSVTWEVAGPVGRITLNRPHRLNAISPDLITGFLAAIDDLESDPAVRAIVLHGEGRGFCSGGDLDHPLFRSDDAEERGAMIDAGYEVTRRLRGSPLPVVVAVHGPCAGAGVALAAAGDFRVAAKDAVFSLDFVRLGILPDMGTCHLLPRLVGVGKAAEMALTAERVDAAEARRIGLVGKVVDGSDLLPTARALAERVAGMPAHGVATIKQAFQELPFLDMSEAFERESVLLDRMVSGPESREAVAALVVGGPEGVAPAGQVPQQRRS